MSLHPGTGSDRRGRVSLPCDTWRSGLYYSKYTDSEQKGQDNGTIAYRQDTDQQALAKAALSDVTRRWRRPSVPPWWARKRTEAGVQGQFLFGGGRDYTGTDPEPGNHHRQPGRLDPRLQQSLHRRRDVGRLTPPEPPSGRGLEPRSIPRT